MSSRRSLCCPLLPKTIITVNRSTTFWFKRHLRFFSATSTSGCEHLAWSAITAEFSFFLCSTVWTTRRRIGKSFFFVELLFSSSPNKLIAAIAAGKSLILHYFRLLGFVNSQRMCQGVFLALSPPWKNHRGRNYWKKESLNLNFWVYFKTKIYYTLFKSKKQKGSKTMLTYPGQDTPQHKLRARLEQVWPTIHGWVEGGFWGTLGLVRTFINAIVNVFLNR